MQELTPRETALKLGIRLDGVYSLLWAGKLKGRKKDGRWLISAGDVGQRARKDLTKSTAKDFSVLGPPKDQSTTRQPRPGDDEALLGV